MAVDTQYDVGDEVPLAFDYAVAGVATNPATLAIHFVAPSGLATSFNYPAAISQTATGSYFYPGPSDEAGWWMGWWAAAGPVPVVVQFQYFVVALPRAYP